MTDDQQPIDLGYCKSYVIENVFKLQEAGYSTQYPKWPGMVGLEIEMGVIQRATLDAQKPKMLPLRGQQSICSVLEKMSRTEAGWQLNYDQTANDRYLLNVTLAQGDNLSFEPGGQLEFSTRPYPCLQDALSRVSEMQNLLNRNLAAVDAELIQYGINPWLTVDELGLQMTKPRYQAMNQFFSHLSSNGQRMMRQTCTVQVNLDFGSDETTLAKRYLVGNLLAPFATGIFAYSPMHDGALNGYKSYRAKIWQGLDHTRTGFPSGLARLKKQLNRATCAEIYTDSLLDAAVVFVAPLKYRVMDGTFTFRQWLLHGIDGLFPTAKDWETHLTLHFPEVRARGFIELRSVDCQSHVWQAVPALFYCSLLYIDSNLERAYQLLLPLLNDLPMLLEQSVYGLSNPIIAKYAVTLMEMVITGLGGLSSCFRGSHTDEVLAQFFARFTSQGRCPADAIIDLVKKKGSRLTPRELLNLDAEWAKGLPNNLTPVSL